MQLLLNDEIVLLKEWFNDTYRDWHLEVSYTYNVNRSREELLVQVSSKDRTTLGVIPSFITNDMQQDELWRAKTKSQFFPSIRNSITEYITDHQK